VKQLYPKSVTFDNLDLHIESATALSFPDTTFDFIYSSWVFEHINDVTMAVGEVNRILKKRGIARIVVHLFPSISGGHNLEWQFPDISRPRKAPPWDHLLENKFPANVFLNKLKLQNYRQIFKDKMKIIEEKIVTNGLSHLAQELEARLLKKGFSREDLISERATFICTKKNE
jgi:ubiquinone/menaquinone biosynthesis C-methylase UbiE